MPAATKPKGSRLSPEKLQENKSRRQFQEWVDDLQWTSSSVETDVGEDFVVQIFNNGDEAVLAFLVQLKSITDAAARKPKRAQGLIRYRLEVKKLTTWERSINTVVVLVVWDVKARKGYWQTIPAILEELDKNNVGWRKKKKVTVSVPVKNTTDVEGAKRLRWAVADHSLPLISKQGVTVQVSFSIPAAETEALSALRRWEDTGEPLTIDGKFITRFKHADWHRRLYGEQYPMPEWIEFGSSYSKVVLRVRIEIESPHLPFVAPFVELRVVKQGKKEVTLSNDHQSIPHRLTVVFNSSKPTIHFSFAVKTIGTSVYEARDVQAVALALRSAHKIRIVDVDTGRLIGQKTNEQPSSGDDLEPIRDYYELLEKLCFIQQRIDRYGTLSMEHGIEGDDIENAEHLFKILRDGNAEANCSFSLLVAPGASVTASDRPDVEFRQQGGRLKLLNLLIPIGSSRARPTDPSKFVATVLEARQEANRTGKPVKLSMKNIPVVLEYLDLGPAVSPWDRLYDMAVPQAGYFTMVQAQQAGYIPDILESLVVEKRMERITDEVFRLVHFPASDHEDLMVIWLQTDRQGVFSHETALALYDLSDWLPAMRHVTVPPSSNGAFKVDPGVVLHRQLLAESEITWRAGVPVTTPLRTLRDCVEAAVPSEFIEQAIAEGVERGLFTYRDIPWTAEKSA